MSTRHERASTPRSTARALCAPHGPGDNPYVVHELATDLQRRTQWTGEVKPNPKGSTLTTRSVHQADHADFVVRSIDGSRVPR